MRNWTDRLLARAVRVSPWLALLLCLLLALTLWQMAVAGDAERTQLLWFALGLTALLLAVTVPMMRAHARAMTDAAATAAQLQVSEERFRAVAESASDAIITADEQGRIVYLNPAAERMFGYPAAEVAGLPLMLFAADDDRERYASGFAAMIKTDIPELRNAVYEANGRRKSGEIFPVELTVSKWQAGGQVFTTFIERDISARRHAEAMIRALNEDLERRVAERTAELRRMLGEYERVDQFRKSVIDSAVFGVVKLDAAGRIAIANGTFCRMLGYPADQLLGRHWSELLRAEARAKVLPMLDALMRQGRPIRDCETELAHRDGMIVNILFGANPLGAQDGTSESMLAVMDITDRKRAEARTQRFNAELERRVTERTAELQAANTELEAFTYSISHDLRAPLRHINGHVAMLLEDSADLDPQRRQRLRRIADAALRMGNLIDDLLRFARMGKVVLRKRGVEMSALVERARAILAHETAERHIEWEIGALPRVQCDPDLLQQVWVDLFGNALKFTRARQLARISVAAERAGGEWVFSVRDNGVGFDMRYVDRLYRVFERLHTGEWTEGTGIGLASVRRVVERHGGRVWAVGAVDEGAVFYFTLPAAA